MSAPVFLYVYGKADGPFKVGYSNNPRQRAKGLRCVLPSSFLGGSLATMQHVAVAGTSEQARMAERTAHDALARCRLPRSASPLAGHYSSPLEWFAVPLKEAVAAVDHAVAAVQEAAP